MARLTLLLTLAFSAALSLQAAIAAPAELPPGRYRISSVAANGNSPAGVNPSRPMWQPVRIDALINVWEVKENESGSYHLNLADSYPFTGVEGKTVAATVESDRDVNWRIEYHEELKAFSIASTFTWPTPAWTLESGTVTISLYELYPKNNQLWTFERVEN